MSEVMREEPVVIHYDRGEKPTVEVRVLNPMPQLVEVVIVNAKEHVDNKNQSPQLHVKLQDATGGFVGDAKYRCVVKTPKEHSDIILAVDSETYSALAKVGLDPFPDIIQAINKGKSYPQVVEPYQGAPLEKVRSDIFGKAYVTVPRTIPQIVEVLVVMPKAPQTHAQILIEPVARNIPFGHDLVPLKLGENTIIAAINADDLVRFYAHYKNTVDEVVVAALNRVNPAIMMFVAPKELVSAPIDLEAIKAEDVPPPAPGQVYDYDTHFEVPDVDSRAAAFGKRGETVTEEELFGTLEDYVDGSRQIAMMDDDDTSKPTVQVNYPWPTPVSVELFYKLTKEDGKVNKKTKKPQCIFYLKPSEPMVIEQSDDYHREYVSKGLLLLVSDKTVQALKRKEIDAIDIIRRLYLLLN